ncbi:hypothetical protein CCR75_005314 [Bremia lactucae]|uniref:Uncharacterized protein n=1 Tax=Bremia lactucae TaxID=4779 RepID=A0A976FJX4_BRELC|nr:hypothetical protein CCR75_005314 [Bremia lactucae]
MNSHFLFVVMLLLLLDASQAQEDKSTTKLSGQTLDGSMPDNLKFNGTSDGVPIQEINHVKPERAHVDIDLSSQSLSPTSDSSSRTKSTASLRCLHKIAVHTQDVVEVGRHQRAPQVARDIILSTSPRSSFTRIPDFEAAIKTPVSLQPSLSLSSRSDGSSIPLKAIGLSGSGSGSKYSPGTVTLKNEQPALQSTALRLAAFSNQANAGVTPFTTSKKTARVATDRATNHDTITDNDKKHNNSGSGNSNGVSFIVCIVLGVACLISALHVKRNRDASEIEASTHCSPLVLSARTSQVRVIIDGNNIALL